MKNAILTVPNPGLRKKSKPVTNILSIEIQKLLLDLEETLKKSKDPEGVGLSLPQIGHNLRAFVLKIERKTRFYLNPEILDISEKTTLGPTLEKPILEGCLSVPHLYGPVLRPYKIKIKAINEKGDEFTKTLTSFRARVYLHELEHLNGILFTDHTLKQNQPLYLLKGEDFIKIKSPHDIISW